MSLCFMLTAGEGRRLRPFTEKRIKPRFELLNLPLAYYGLYLARNAGITNYLFNKHHLPHQVDELAQDVSALGVDVQVSDESEKLLGSGGALWKAKPILEQHDYFLIANGDEVLIPGNDKVIRELFDIAKTKNALCTLLTCNHPDLLNKFNGVWVNDKKQVRGFGKSSPESGLTPTHYTGYKVFSKRIFEYLPDGESNIFYEVVKNAIDQGEVVINHHIGDTLWMETGNPASFFKASQRLCHEVWDDVQVRLAHFERPLNSQLKTDTAHIVFSSEQKTQYLLENLEGFVSLPTGDFRGHHFKNCIVQSSPELLQNSYHDTIVI